jgi:hypothetical protein
MKLFELQDRPEQEKNFDRNIMPQIRKGNLQNSPFKFKKGKIRLEKLKPVQSQRVKGMHDKAKKGFEDGSIRPIVIDKNNFIVNGHHRYDVARGLELKKVRVLKVDASIEDLIDHFTDTASPEPTYEQKMKAKLDSLMETIEASQDISALMKGIEADLKQREKDLKRLPKKSVYEAPIIRPQDSYDPDANDAYNTATNRRPPKYDYDPEMDYRPGKSLGKIPNIQSETEVVQMPNGDLYLFYANSMSVSSRETPRQKSIWQNAISWMLQNPKANQTGPKKEKNVIGFLKLKPFEDGYRVAGVGMDPEIRGQGKAIKFYLAFSAWKGVPIYSDFTQTPSAKTMWNSIIGRYPKRVVAYDQKSKKDIPLAKAGDMYQDQPDGFDDMSQFKAAKVLGGTKLFKLLPEGNVSQLKPQTSGTKKPSFSPQRSQEAFEEWKNGAAVDTDIKIVGNDNQLYYIRQNTDGESQHFVDDAWYLTDDDYEIVDTEGYSDPGDLLFSHSATGYEPIDPNQMDENFDVVDGNFPIQQRDREMQQGIERELKMYKILERLAQMWWNNDEDPAVEKKLADMGWEVGEDEGSDTPSVFVIEIGDENGNSYISWPIEQLEKDVVENFADGKKKGKSRPGRVKKAGASCNGSVTSLRKKAKNSSGEKSKMYHWCANMKAGRKKSK